MRESEQQTNYSPTLFSCCGAIFTIFAYIRRSGMQIFNSQRLKTENALGNSLIAREILQFDCCWGFESEKLIGAASVEHEVERGC